MKRYIDIIDELKEGKKVEYEEVMKACLMANALLYFTEGHAKKLIKSDFLKKHVEKELENNFNIRKKTPDEFFGKETKSYLYPHVKFEEWRTK